MIFVGLAFAFAMFAYAIYNVIDPTAAHEFWVRNVTGGWRLPWIDDEDPEYIRTMRVMGIIGIAFFGFATFALASAAISGQR